MNTKFEQWLDMYSFDIDGEGEYVDVSDLRDFLKTHAIVPRKPSKTMLNSGATTLMSDYCIELVYNAMIKAAENEY